MLLNKKLTPLALATALAASGLAVPGVASAEVSGNMGIASFYLWRGLDVSGQAQVSGGLDYGHESGAYAGIWVTSQGFTAGTETDLYFGYAGEAGPVSYDVSFWSYQYPQANTLNPPGDLNDSDLSEVIVGLGMADVGLTFILGNDFGGTAAGFDDYVYTSIDYTYGDFNFLYGMWAMDTITGQDDSHVTISYAASDKLTLTMSMGMQDTDASYWGYDEDPIFHVGYSLPVEM